MIWLLLLALVGVIAWSQRRAVVAAREQEALRAEVLDLQEEKRIYFSFLHDLGEAFSDDLNQKRLLQVVLHCATTVTDAQSGAVYLLDKATQTLRPVAVDGMFPPPLPVAPEEAARIATRQEFLAEHLRGEPVPATGATVIGKVALEGRPELVKDARGDERFPKFGQEPLRTHSYLAVPLEYRQEMLGVIAVANRRDDNPFNESDLGIVRTVAQQAAYSFHAAQLYTQLAEKRKLDSDLEAAREIQRILLPDASPQLANYSVAALNLPAQQVSGDYYDFIPLKDGCWGLAIADVSGKGISASLIMAMCRSVLRSIATTSDSASPAQILRELNRQLYPDIREDMFITMTYVVLDPQRQIVRLARAGHEAPLVYRHAERRIDAIRAPGLALGIDSGEVFDEVIDDVVVTLDPLDTMVLYTDGVTEATDEGGLDFGRENLKTALLAGGAQSVDFLVKNVVDRVQRFSLGAAQSDDITLVALQRSENSNVKQV